MAMSIEEFMRGQGQGEPQSAQEVSFSGTTVDTTVKTGIKPDKKNGGIGHIVMKPIKWTADAVFWISNPTRRGGAKYVMYGMAFLAWGLSVENFYVMLNKDQAENIRFIPKPAIDDSADLTRLLPFPTVLDAVHDAFIKAINLTGANLKDNWAPKVNLIVWSDINFYVAIIVASMLNAIEAIAIRKVSLNVRKRQFAEAKAEDSQKEAAIAQTAFEGRLESLKTKVKRTQVKTHGDGEVVMMGAIILAAYLFEFGSFVSNTVPSTKFLTALIYGLASVFGAETFYFLAQSFDKRDTED